MRRLWTARPPGPARAHNRGMLRLDPRHPPLWRSASSLQFGASGVALIEDLAPWQERMIAALTDGIPASAYEACARAFGAEPREAMAFRALLAPVLQDGDAPPRAPVRVELPHDLPPILAEALTDALAEAGASPAMTPWWDMPGVPVGSGDPVVAVAAHVLDPRRTARFMREDIPHVPIVLADDRVEVGPAVVPGVTACTSCVHAHRRDADAAWPAIAAQLLTLPAPDTPRGLLYDAGAIAVRLLSARPDRGGRSATVLARRGRVTWHANPPHEECLCRSHARSATPLAPVVPFPVPTTATVSARRA